MPFVTSFDGTRLYVEATGEGPAIVFAHEFGGDWRSWKVQVAHFSNRYRCVTYCARGVLPSEAPDDVTRYGQAASTADLLHVVGALGLGRFHLVGLSMGSFTGLMFALAHPGRLLSLTLAGCSSGASSEADRDAYRKSLAARIALLDERLGDGAAGWLSQSVGYEFMAAKRPELWERYCDNQRTQSVAGARHTLSTVHWNRESFFGWGDQLRQLSMPALLIFGDTDHPFIEPSNFFLAANLKSAQLRRLPRTGHLVNLEEPREFSQLLETTVGFRER